MMLVAIAGDTWNYPAALEYSQRSELTRGILAGFNELEGRKGPSDLGGLL